MWLVVLLILAAVVQRCESKGKTTQSVLAAAYQQDADLISSLKWDCTPVEPSLVYYNRILKSGSVTISGVLESTKNSVATVATSGTSAHSYSKRARKHLATHLNSELVQSQLKAREAGMAADRAFVVVIDHCFWWDVKLYGFEHEPAFVTVMRNPVDRVISNFYYEKKVNHKAHLKYGYNMTLEECVADDSCSALWFGSSSVAQLNWLCGMEDDCANRTVAEKLSSAKQRVMDGGFHLVGVTEDLPSFFQIVDKTLPTRFSGTAAKYEREVASGTSTHNPTDYEEPSDQVKAALQTLVSAEVELYAFVKAILAEKRSRCHLDTAAGLDQR